MILNCFDLYLLLKQYYPQAMAYHDSDHVITKIDKEFFDKTGKVEQGKYLPIHGLEWNMYIIEKIK